MDSNNIEKNNSLAIITKVISEKAQLQVKDGEIYINESEKGATLKSIQISGFDDVVGINHDKCSLNSNSINIKGARKTCDGIIFFKLKEKHYILITDLKSSLSNSEEHQYKTKSGKNFISYLNCLLNQFEGVDISGWEIYYCIFIDIEKYNHRRLTGVSPEFASKLPSSPTRIPIANNSKISIQRLLYIRI